MFVAQQGNCVRFPARYLCAGFCMTFRPPGRCQEQRDQPRQDRDRIKSNTIMKSASHHPPSSGPRILTGLLGAPIAHSASPAMHERAAEALGLRCHYQLIEVGGAAGAELKLVLEGVRRLGFAGINVTFPYKEAVVGLLDELSPGAAQIGAVNTVVVRDGMLIGHNTDTTGFARAVTHLVTASAHGPVALIGAGGVGKAIAFALAGLGVAELRIFDS